MGTALTFLLMLTASAWAADAPGMCAGQPPVTGKEMGETLDLMNEIIELGETLAPEDEETIIRSRGITAERMNCILGKLMAGSDIFNWGPPEAYGVSLNPTEMKAAKNLKTKIKPLKKYLEDTLNIKAEDT